MTFEQWWNKNDYLKGYVDRDAAKVIWNAAQNNTPTLKWSRRKPKVGKWHWWKCDNMGISPTMFFIPELKWRHHCNRCQWAGPIEEPE